MLRVYFGYHRSGSSWTTRLVEDACDRMKLRCAVLHDGADVDDLGAWVKERRVQVLCWTNTDGARLSELGQIRGAHVVRDPRDVVVSAYFSHLLSHPTEGLDWLVPHRQELEELSREEGLLAEVRCRSLQFEQLLAWPGHAAVEELRFEEMIGSPHTEVPRLLAALDLVGSRGLRRRLSTSEAQQIAHDHRFQLLAAGRTPGTEDPSHHYRRGTPGDWRAHLTPAHIALINTTWPQLIPRFRA
jgi:hypothetical protein